jgi:hypothetical protein
LYGKAWVEQMRMYADLEPVVLLEKSLYEYKKFNDIAILKYALNALSNTKFRKTTWTQIQPLLLNILVKLPCLSKFITNILLANKDNIAINMLRKSLYSILEINLVQKYDEEVIWAIWMIKIFKIRINTQMIHDILMSDNWIAIIILLDTIANRRTETTIKEEVKRFRERIKDECFDNSNSTSGMNSGIWLLAYEAERNEWLNTGNEEADKFIVIPQASFFEKLKQLGVSFYNSDNCYTQNNLQEQQRSQKITRNELIKLIQEISESVAGRNAEQNNTNLEISNDLVRRMRIAMLFAENY